MKKRGMLLLSMLSLCLAMAGCGNSSSSNNEETNTHMIDTVMGEIQVPKKPERVVVNWYIGDAYSLNLNVVGYFAWEQKTMPFYEKFLPSTKLENWAAEDIMAVEPDLIITYAPEDYEKFNKIAPVLVIPEEDVNSAQRLRIIGEATGKEVEAEALITTFEEKLAIAKAELESEKYEGKTFSIMEDWGPTGDWNGVAYETGSRGGTLVYKYLELKMPEKLEQLIAKNGEGRDTLSYEVAHEYFGDYILWFQQEGKESEYAKSDIWKSIPAVAEGRVAEIPGENLGLFFYDDISSLTAQLDYTIDAIKKISE